MIDLFGASIQAEPPKVSKRAPAKPAATAPSQHTLKSADCQPAPVVVAKAPEAFTQPVAPPADPRRCIGKLPTSWASAFRPPAAHICSCCKEPRFWRSPRRAGWLCATCYPPIAGHDIPIERVDTSKP